MHSNFQDLATEALFINQNFRRQVLKRNEHPYIMAHPRAPFEEEGGESGCGYRCVYLHYENFCSDKLGYGCFKDRHNCCCHSSLLLIHFRYRKWTLGKNANGKPIEVVCRTEHDGVMVSFILSFFFDLFCIKE